MLKQGHVNSRFLFVLAYQIDACLYHHFFDNPIQQLSKSDLNKLSFWITLPEMLDKTLRIPNTYKCSLLASPFIQLFKAIIYTSDVAQPFLLRLMAAEHLSFQRHRV